ncbi:hypothetical protein H4J58_13255 [Colwellia sp. MB3u-70]|uniref:hypothetical protein n=1 Tax=unclassified Colwellia TaxID=196834 RepID=UPI0015F5964C|nr:MULTISPECIES: hypothetical protein [unclassified Colwellia]MBA6292835.1 hypothetical protein [Colwellia sp. MB3u-8]MBA6308081.1 hypothetical protein [Colwellia sp. MB3u-70]
MIKKEIAIKRSSEVTLAKTKNLLGITRKILANSQSLVLSTQETRWINLALNHPEIMVALISKYYPLEGDVIENYTEQLGWNNWPGYEDTRKAEEEECYRECGDIPPEMWRIENADCLLTPDLLSSNTSLPWSESFIERFSDKWDWRWLSKNTSLPWSESLIERFKDKWDWSRLSLNTALPWSESFVERYAEKWHWMWLSSNTALPWSESFILRYAGKWHWFSVVTYEDFENGGVEPAGGYILTNEAIYWSESLLEQIVSPFEYIYESDSPSLDDDFFERDYPWLGSFLERNYFNHICISLFSNTLLPCSEGFIVRYADRWDWEGLSGNTALPWSEGFIERYADKWGWCSLSCNTSLPWSELLIERYAAKWGWKGLSENTALPWSASLIERYAAKWGWKGLSENTALSWSETLIERYADKWDWESLSRNTSLPWSESLIERYADKWDWESLSRNTSLPWSESLIVRYVDKWDWSSLGRNIALPWSDSLIERYADKYNGDWEWQGLSGNTAIEYVFESNESESLARLIKNIDKKVIIEILKVLPKVSSNVEL